MLVTDHDLQGGRVASRARFVFDRSLVEFADIGRSFADPADPRTAAFVRGKMVC